MIQDSLAFLCCEILRKLLKNTKKKNGNEHLTTQEAIAVCVRASCFSF